MSNETLIAELETLLAKLKRDETEIHYKFLCKPFWDKAPAVRALGGKQHPSAEHLRACIMELCCYVESLNRKVVPQQPTIESLKEWATAVETLETAIGEVSA